MRKFTPIKGLLLLIAFLSIYGCNPITIPLKGKYVDAPVNIRINKPADSAWQMITDEFSAKGLDVKRIDKVKGVLLTKKTGFISAYTSEDQVGHLEEPGAWVVLHKVFIKKNEWVAKKIYSQWKISITQTSKDSTLVLIDPVVICTYYPNMFTTVETRGQSTGVLEGLIMDFNKH